MADETLVFPAAFVTVLFLYSLVSLRIERTVITAGLLLTALSLLEAAILAPTDAALGEEIATSEKVPLRICQALVLR